jgi:two-component system, LytTR family, sensor kinase
LSNLSCFRDAAGKRLLTRSPPSMSALPPSPRPQTPRRSDRPSPLAVFVLWAFVAAAVIGMTAVALSLKSGAVDLLERTIWDIGWIGWAPLTYLVLALCRRHPIDRQRKLPTVLRLALYGLGVVALQILFDFLCINILGHVFRDTPLSWQYLIYITAYKAHIYYGVYWMIVGAAHAYEFHARYLRSQVISSQLETKLANAELSLLKGQLQPHFLFNTHNSIMALMLKQDNAAAIRMLTRLSDLLRISLSHSRRQVVGLREELATLRLYLDIQHERFRDRLTIELDVPDELHDAGVPHLLLQPLVENSLAHGLADVTENGRLEVRARRDANMLELTVRDNGAGFDGASSAGRGKPTGGGVGLSNTQERLQQLYGDAQSLEIRSTPGQGCTVTIRLPYRPAAAVQPENAERQLAHTP